MKKSILAIVLAAFAFNATACDIMAATMAAQEAETYAQQAADAASEVSTSESGDDNEASAEEAEDYARNAENAASSVAMYLGDCNQ